MERFHAEYSNLMAQTALGLMNHTAELQEIAGGCDFGFLELRRKALTNAFDFLDLVAHGFPRFLDDHP